MKFGTQLGRQFKLIDKRFRIRRSPVFFLIAEFLEEQFDFLIVGQIFQLVDVSLNDDVLPSFPPLKLVNQNDFKLVVGRQVLVLLQKSKHVWKRLFSCEEIATELGISKSAVMTQLFRARQKLKTALDPESGGDDGKVHRLA